MLMAAGESDRVVVGLGNPGSEYCWTRHNVGSHAVMEFTQKHGLRFRSDKDLVAQVAKGTNVYVAVPKTFMNESGRAVGRLMRFVKSDLKALLVVVDDIETPFGEMNLVFAGGTRGHNGLKSIKMVLGSMDFTQLRIGVGRPDHPDVAGHVLARFTKDEMEQMPAVMENARILIEKWLVGV